MWVGSCGDTKLGSQMKAGKQCEVKQAPRESVVETSALYKVLWPWLKGFPKVTHMARAYQLVKRAEKVALLLKANPKYKTGRSEDMVREIYG